MVLEYLETEALVGTRLDLVMDLIDDFGDWLDAGGINDVYQKLNIPQSKNSHSYDIKG